MQRIGIETRDMWHKTDWEAVGKDASLVEMPRPKWIFGHDCQTYAYEEFEKVVRILEGEGTYEPHNIPMNGSNHREMDFRDVSLMTSGQALEAES